MGSSLNKTQSLYLKNNSAQNVTRGDVVIIDKTAADSFTLTGSSGYTQTMIGVVLDQTTVAAGASCLVAIGGYIPVINLDIASNIGDTFFLSSTIKKASPHSTGKTGDFGHTLNSGLTPDAILFDAIQLQQLTGTISGGYTAISPKFLQDTLTGTWDGTIARITGTYTFDLQSAFNGLPANITAINVTVSANFAGSGGGRLLSIRSRGDTIDQAGGAASSDSTVRTNVNGIIGVDSVNKDIDVIVFGSLTSGSCRVIGYFT